MNANSCAIWLITTNIFWLLVVRFLICGHIYNNIVILYVPYCFLQNVFWYFFVFPLCSKPFLHFDLEFVYSIFIWNAFKLQIFWSSLILGQPLKFFIQLFQFLYVTKPFLCLFLFKVSVLPYFRCHRRQSSLLEY